MKYILFGTGDYYKRFRHWFEEREVVAILDNDADKQGMMIDGRPVIAPNELKNHEYDCIVILSFYITEMKKQLIEIGVPEGVIYHFYDLHELFERDRRSDTSVGKKRKSILLLSHDLTLGGPALALYHAAISLKKSGYEVVFASMLDGALREKLENSFIPVVIDKRLQIGTMNELTWTGRYDLILCNTINYHTFLSDRNTTIPVLWWLHDSPFFYEGIKPEKLQKIEDTNLRMLSVGPVPKKAMEKYRKNVNISDLIYGVLDGI